MFTQREFVSRKQLAAYLGVSLATVDRLLKEREIPFIKIRGKVLFTKEKLSEWLDGLEIEANKKPF